MGENGDRTLSNLHLKNLTSLLFQEQHLEHDRLDVRFTHQSTSSEKRTKQGWVLEWGRHEEYHVEEKGDDVLFSRHGL